MCRHPGGFGNQLSQDQLVIFFRGLFCYTSGVGNFHVLLFVCLFDLLQLPYNLITFGFGEVALYELIHGFLEIDGSVVTITILI